MEPEGSHLLAAAEIRPDDLKRPEQNTNDSFKASIGRIRSENATRHKAVVFNYDKPLPHAARPVGRFCVYQQIFLPPTA